MPVSGDALPETFHWLLEPPKGSGLATPDWLKTHPTAEKALQTLSESTPYFLAGGLTPDNIGALLTRIRPFAVDTASGVESAPGIKSADAIRRFCQAVKPPPQASSFSADALATLMPVSYPTTPEPSC